MGVAITTDTIILEAGDRRVPCTTGGVIGRTGELARELFQGQQMLSRKHFRLDLAAGHWCLTLLPEARNRTWVDGSEMNRGQRYVLDGRHLIQVDTFQFLIRVGRDESSTAGVGGLLGYADVGDLVAALSVGPVAMVALDKQLRTAWTNGPAGTLLGGGDDRKRFFNAVADDDVLALRDRLLQMDEGTGVVQASFHLEKKHGGGKREIDARFVCVQELLLGVLEDVTDQKTHERTVEHTSASLEEHAKALALFSLSKAFQTGDLVRSLSLLTTKTCGVLRCSRVRVWLRVEGGVEDELVCRSSHEEPPEPGVLEQKFRPGYCPSYFERVRSTAHLASEVDGSPVFGVLKKSGFVRRSARSVLTVAIQLGETFHGVITFERSEGDPKWSEPERHFVLCVANFCLLAVEANQKKSVIARLQDSESRTEAELAEAERYVRRILPEPLAGPGVTSEWEFLPSEQLGGDSFGYHERPDGHLAIYMIDVVGHGLGAALLSISVMNTLRSELLPADFDDPAAVLTAMNRAFKMEEQNMLTFTMWYGVFDPGRSLLRYASAGHPPALLLYEDAETGGTDYRELANEGFLIGGLDDSEYANAEIAVPLGAKLFVFTDGAFEIPVGGEKQWSFEEFIASVRSTQFMESGEPGYLLTRVRALCSDEHLPDDFCIVCFRFSG